MNIKYLSLFKKIEEDLNLDWQFLFNYYVKEPTIKKGVTYYIPCPFHWEATPSFGINFQKKVLKCFWCWKAYVSILSFLKDYLSLTPQSLLSTLQNNWHLPLLDLLGWQFDSFLSSEIKRTIFKYIEIPLKEKDELHQRVLFNKWGIWRVDEEIIEELKQKKEKSWKSWKKAEMAEKIIDEFSDMTKNGACKALIDNEYSNLTFYFTKQKHKANSSLAWTDFSYVYNQEESEHIELFKKNNAIRKTFSIQSNNENYLSLIKENITKNFLTSTGYKKFLSENLNFDTKLYYDALLDFFLIDNDEFQKWNLNYFVGEWFFDTYSLGLIGIPYISNWTGFSIKKANNFIKYLSKRDLWMPQVINVCFDNDKAWLLWTVKLVNEFIRLTRQNLITTSKFDMKIFNFKKFEIQIIKFFSCLTSFVKKKEEDLLQNLEQLQEKINWKGFAISSSDYEIIFFEHFADVQNRFTLYESLKKKFEYNYKKNDKAEEKWYIIKDMWELPVVFFSLVESLMYLKGEINGFASKNKENYFNTIYTIVIYNFNSIFYSSFMSIDEFKKYLDKKIDSKEITYSEINRDVKENFILTNNEEKNIKKSAVSRIFDEQFMNFFDSFDTENQALQNINLIGYDNDIKETCIIKPDEFRALRKIVRSEWQNFIPKKASQYLNELSELKKEIESLVDVEKTLTKEEELQFSNLQEKEMNTQHKVIYLFNIWTKILWWKLDDLWMKIFESFWYKEREIVNILTLEDKWITTPLADRWRFMVNYYEAVKEILDENIKLNIQKHWDQDSQIKPFLLKKSILLLS